MPSDSETLRSEVDFLVLEEVERVGISGLKKSVVVAGFRGRASRATLYRYIDDTLQSGRANRHLAHCVAQSTAMRASLDENPSFGAAKAAMARLGSPVKVNDVIALGGPLAVMAELATCFAAARDVMEFAREDDGRVRDAKLLLAGADSLRRSIETATHTARTLCDLDAVDHLHASFIEEMAKESPEVAERMVMRATQFMNRLEVR